MAEVQTKQLTWQEKLAQGVPLNPLEETKADADFNFKQRAREQEEKRRFEDLKNNAGRVEAPAEQPQTEKGNK